MHPPASDDLVVRRQLRCRELVSDISSQRQGPRPRPNVVFVDKADGATRGRFSWRHNRVTVVIPGFLDDPTIPEGTVDAVVAHEMGHWADPDVARQSYRAVAIGVPLLMLSATLLIAQLLLSPPASLAAALSAVAMCAAAFYAIRYFSWPSEERADRFAVDWVGADAVVSMLERPLKKAARGSTPTHPSVRRRRRLVQRAEQELRSGTAKTDPDSSR